MCVQRESEREREREKETDCAVTFGKSTEDPKLLVGAENEFCFNLIYPALSSRGVCVKAHFHAQRLFTVFFNESAKNCMNIFSTQKPLQKPGQCSHVRSHKWFSGR